MIITGSGGIALGMGGGGYHSVIGGRVSFLGTACPSRFCISAAVLQFFKDRGLGVARSVVSPPAGCPASVHPHYCLLGFSPKLHPLFGRDPEAQHARDRAAPRAGVRGCHHSWPMCSRGAAGAREAPSAGPRGLDHALSARHSSMWRLRRARPRGSKGGPQRGKSCAK